MKEIRYIALGDSYTIGEGAKLEESWPSLMVDNLSKIGLNIELVANPSVTGWTTQDLIEKELPVFDKADCNFVTLLIGVNDWVQGVTPKEYSSNLDFILAHIRKGLPDRSKLVIINIPDFGITPDGPNYSKGRDISAGLEHFNSILLRKAEAFDYPYVDIFPISKEMENDPTLVAKDGLHPSAKEYAIWEPLIREKALQILV